MLILGVTRLRNGFILSISEADGGAIRLVLHVCSPLKQTKGEQRGV